MKRKFILLSVVLSFISLPCWADSAAEKQAEILLNTSGVKSNMQVLADKMLTLEIQQNPALAPYREVLSSFFQKYFDFESIKGDIIKIYAENFTADELAEINTFYGTPIGKKMLQKMPDIASRSAALGMSQVQAHLPELKQMLKDERMRRAQKAKVQPDSQ